MTAKAKKHSPWRRGDEQLAELLCRMTSWSAGAMGPAKATRRGVRTDGAAVEAASALSSSLEVAEEWLRGEPSEELLNRGGKEGKDERTGRQRMRKEEGKRKNDKQNKTKDKNNIKKVKHATKSGRTSRGWPPPGAAEPPPPPTMTTTRTAPRRPTTTRPTRLTSPARHRAAAAAAWWPWPAM